MPDPSIERNRSTRPGILHPRRCRTPPRLPSPSSRTFATNVIVARRHDPAGTNARITPTIVGQAAAVVADPRSFEQRPLARHRQLGFFGKHRIEMGGEEQVRPRILPGRSPMTLPSVSMRTLRSPRASNSARISPARALLMECRCRDLTEPDLVLEHLRLTQPSRVQWRRGLRDRQAGVPRSHSLPLARASPRPSAGSAGVTDIAASWLRIHFGQDVATARRPCSAVPAVYRTNASGKLLEDQRVGIVTIRHDDKAVAARRGGPRSSSGSPSYLRCGRNSGRLLRPSPDDAATRCRR